MADRLLAAVFGALLALTPMGSGRAAPADGPVVFAAASMKTALDAIAVKFAEKTGKKTVISYASSGVLAKQIESGAPADLFISADEKWMAYLADKGAIKPETRDSLLGNALVLVASAGDPAAGDLTIAPGFNLSGALAGGKLAVCTVASCPAGIYGKEALEKLGVYTGVAPQLAQAENVRAALLLVARGEAKFGIVYATDAKAEPKVKVVGIFPENTHTPIVYPVALTRTSTSPEAAAFEAFLRSPESLDILKQQGFSVLAK